MCEKNKDKKEKYTIEFSSASSLAADFLSDVDSNKRTVEEFEQILTGAASLLPDETHARLASAQMRESNPFQPTVEDAENLLKEANKIRRKYP